MNIDQMNNIMGEMINQSPEIAVDILAKLDESNLMGVLAAGGIGNRNTQEAFRTIVGVVVLWSGRLAEYHKDREEIGQYAAVKRTVENIFEDVNRFIETPQAKETIDEFNALLSKSATEPN